jgi:lipopolysaccharide heptosyltransferase II
LEEALMDRLVFAVYWLLSHAICLLPITGVFRLGHALGTCVYFLAWPYRRLVLRNLGIAFGKEKSEAELRVLARAHFAMLGANLFSSFKLPRMSRDEILAVVKIEGLEIMEAAVASGHGISNIVGHFGMWELFAQLSPLVFPCKAGAIFQALSNRFIDAEVRRDRARLGLALFEKKEGFVEACRFMRSVGAVGVLADQHAGDVGQWSPFFGRLASTSTLAATLALRTGAWIVPAGIFTDGVARWRAVFFPRIETRGETAEQITVRVNQAIEHMVRAQPEGWFWVHNRWKTPKPNFLLAGYKRGVTLAPGADPKRDLQPFRILIRGSNWLGDAIMSVPAVRAIKAGRVDAHVTILTPAKLADVWRSVPEVDEVITIDPGERVFAVARKIRRDFDVAVLFPNSLRVALEAWLAGIPRRVGYPGHHRRRLLNSVLAPKKKKKETQPPRHQVHHYLALAEFVGAKIPGEADVLPAANRRPSAGGNPVIGLCPGAEYGPAKRWLPERYAEVVKTVHEATACEWKIFGVAKDRPVADAIVAAADVPCTDLVGRTSLAQLMDELRTCDLLLTNDTGTMHIAAFLGIPTVAIFGSTEPSLTGPLGAHHQVLRHHVACSPCFLRECPLDFRCMKAVEVPEVVRAVLTGVQNRT